MILEKIDIIAGIILLILGISLIIYPLWQTYNIFTGASLPPQIFMKPVNDSGIGSSENSIEAQIEKAVSKSFPTEALYGSLNLWNWIVLMFILMYGGGKLADIGIKLLK